MQTLTRTPTDTTTRPRLLGSWHAHHRSDLATHVAFHGALPIPNAAGEGWSASLGELIRQAGLTGRGGASFPTASKFALMRRSGTARTIVVNAMEGEPASDKAAVLLECVPHLVLDGAELLARALRAQRVLVCVPDVLDRTAQSAAHAIAERSRGALAPVAFDVVRPPSRYISGEESALTSWLDGRPALPRFRPDKSVPLSIGRAPALVHNAETLAHIALIARYGPGWFRECGTFEAPGTCLVTLSGCVEHPGVYEVALGTPVSSVIALAMPSGGVRAVLTGGYGGTWLGCDALNTPLAPAPLAELGASVGAGVLVVLDESACGITETARIAAYMASQGAGQCGPCMFGLPAIAEDFALVAGGAGDTAVFERLAHRFGEVEGRGACRHPDGVVRMARSALEVFAEDAKAHALGRPCEKRTSPSVVAYR